MNSFVCLFVLLDRKGGWGNCVLLGWFYFVFFIYLVIVFLGLFLLVDVSFMIVVVNLRLV